MDELHKRQKIISQLVEARLEQGISQAELARRLGIQRSGINRLESGTQNPSLDMILKIASALGKDVSLKLNDKEEPMSHVYSLRMYDTELMRFSMEKQGLSGLVAEILYTNEEQAHLLPLDMERTGDVGAGMEEGMKLIRQAGFTHFALYSHHEPKLLPIE